MIENALSLLRRFTELKQLPKAKTKNFYNWRPSPLDFLKLNVDGVVFGDLHKASMGIVLRDADGDIVMATNIVENEVNDPEPIELLAILRGL